MSTHAATASSATVPPATVSASSAGAMPAPATAAARTALGLGLAGLAATAAGLAFSGLKTVGFSYLVGITFWTGIALGMLFLVMIHHIFDASWSVVLRRQFEHGLSAFKWLALLFVPLIAIALFEPSLIWKWMDPGYDLSKVGGHGTVGHDILWIKKSGLLNPNFFIVATAASFLIWIWLSARLRKASFTQDLDGDVKWTHVNRFNAALGLPLAAITLTLCIILWVKSLDYHWFSTMYGVWYFAGCARAALSAGVIIMLWLWQRGDYKGILNDNHMHSIGQLMFAFTVFWAYVTFSQYFLIWNANVPEETFWYNIRELNPSDNSPNQWKWVGMFLLFGHFFFPFFALISYPAKLCKPWMKFMSYFITFAFLIDVIYNVLPSKKILSAGAEGGNPYPFVSDSLIWVATALIGIGGVCVWSYLRSFPTAKLIPIRDPRIGECLTHH